MKKFFKVIVVVFLIFIVISWISDHLDSGNTYNQYDVYNETDNIYNEHNEYNEYNEYNAYTNEYYQEDNYYIDGNSNGTQTGAYLVDGETNTYYDPETGRYLTGPTYFPEDTQQTQEPPAEEIEPGVLAMDDWTRADMESIIMSLIMCEYADGISYSPLDSDYFWHAMTYYGVSIAYSYEGVDIYDGYAVYDPLSMETLSQGLFAHSRGLLEIPSGSSHLAYVDENGYYHLLMGEHGDVRVELSDFYLAQDGSYGVYADLVTGGEGVVGQWVVTVWNINGKWCVADMYQYG